MVSLEEIPSSFEFGLITPVYKGKGKDPQVRGSYRGITLSSVLAKSPEFVLLERIIPVLADENVPQTTQTGFQKGVSCTDAIFSCLETISKYVREGDSVYSCFYDLASAFDTVEYPVLLNHLYRAGVVGKTWRLIKNWYTPTAHPASESLTPPRKFFPRCQARICPFSGSLHPRNGSNPARSQEQAVWSKHLWLLPWCLLPCRRHPHPCRQQVGLQPSHIQCCRLCF